ncbi:MAG: hypothetical protein Q8O76_09445 [Chloroflexota bacterium]|nr:hypothetical protein [Chloroflexota bacterium]
MPHRPQFAKFRRASEPAIRDLLVKQRIAALERLLSRLQAWATQAASEPARQALLQKAQEVDQLLKRARRLKDPLSGDRQRGVNS